MPVIAGLIFLGLFLLLAAVIVGVVGVLHNAGADHLLTDHFAVFNYHITGSTGTLLLYGIVVGVVAGVGFSLVLASARQAVGRGRDVQRELERLRHDMAPVDDDLDVRPDADRHPGAVTGEPAPADEAATGGERVSPLGRWSRQLGGAHLWRGGKPTSSTPAQH